MEALHSLIACIVILNIFDLVSTRLGLDAGASEGNPLMKKMVEDYWTLTCVVKVGVVVLASAALYHGYPDHPTFTIVALSVANVWYTYTVIANFAVYFANVNSRILWWD